MKPLRMGLMVPVNNSTMKGELLKWLPGGSTCRTIRIPRGPGLLTRDTVPAYKAKALELARDFADANLDAVVYGCTAAGFLSGPAGDAKLAGELADITGKPVVTTARAMVDALEHSGAHDVAVVTPYDDMVNAQLTAFLGESSIRVRSLRTFRAVSVEELGRITAVQVAELSRETMTDECDALFIACSQLPTHAIVEGLQRELGRPVWSSIQASAWQAKQKLA